MRDELLRSIVADLRPVEKALERPIVTTRSRQAALKTVKDVRERVMQALATGGVTVLDGQSKPLSGTAES